jgi:hypothetical protein
MQHLKQQSRHVYPVDVTETTTELEEICERLGLTKAEAIRDAILHYAAYVRGIKVIETREISRKDAEKEILALIKKRGKAWTSEIADELQLDVVLVNDILQGLAQKGAVK